MVKVKVFATLIKLTGRKILEVPAGSVEELLEKLYSTYPGFEEELERGFMILINGRNIEHLQGLQTSLREEDIVSIFPPAGGG